MSMPEPDPDADPNADPDAEIDMPEDVVPPVQEDLPPVPEDLPLDPLPDNASQNRTPSAQDRMNSPLTIRECVI